MNEKEKLKEVRSRLVEADQNITNLIGEHSEYYPEHTRLAGKREGIRLALEYIREMDKC